MREPATEEKRVASAKANSATAGCHCCTSGTCIDEYEKQKKTGGWFHTNQHTCTRNGNGAPRPDRATGIAIITFENNSVHSET
jgi:hypothetical protein